MNYKIYFWTLIAIIFLLSAYAYVGYLVTKDGGWLIRAILAEMLIIIFSTIFIFN